jgi:hypothetical protein
MKTIKCTCKKPMKFDRVEMWIGAKTNFWRVDKCTCGLATYTKITQRQYLYNVKINENGTK